ncbi:hypothetical protein SERLA73DRAFT_175984 [Serpula lacrymans var. lacrymans S7.3]|uniref:Uncharacterized protein n=1 Tax=Serpula lacrymans var. lacrymans (strain S7.3) TaxID=936435 RepID=F8PLT8_SERL3|nr:hypothetical protein SERLA73DRAFT_175984 [Serpula lacrymans var. lacrymans S7.3]
MQRRLELYASTRYAKKRKYRPKKSKLSQGQMEWMDCPQNIGVESEYMVQ